MIVTQQQQAYAAERVLGGGRRFASVDEASTYIAGLLTASWFTDRWPRVDVMDVRAAHRGAKFSVGGWDDEVEIGDIDLTTNGLDEQTVIHELAHTQSDLTDWASNVGLDTGYSGGPIPTGHVVAYAAIDVQDLIEHLVAMSDDAISIGSANAAAADVAAHLLEGIYHASHNHNAIV